MPDSPSPNTLTLTAEDGHAFAAYSAEPKTSEPVGADNATAPGLVVIQEIFGVNPHIRAVCDGFAGKGFRVVAPALFDRVQRGIELEYGEKGFKVGAGLRQLIPLDYSMMDLAACVEHLGPAVAVIGYCWGGTLAWVAAQRLDIRASVGYYGGGITGHLDADLYCPVMLHFGGEDTAGSRSGQRPARSAACCLLFTASKSSSTASKISLWLFKKTVSRSCANRSTSPAGTRRALGAAPSCSTCARTAATAPSITSAWTGAISASC